MDRPEEHAPHELAPGQTCFGCGRRIPYPRKETSPDSRVVRFRIPLDEYEEFVEIQDAAAQHIGVYKSPYWKYRLSLRGCADLLTGPSAEELSRET